MKRYGDLYERICDIENIRAASIRAGLGKHQRPAVKKYFDNKDYYDCQIKDILETHSYEVSPYNTFKVYEPKERQIYSLPFFPDNVIHWAIINIIGPLINKRLINNTYSCVEGRGIHGIVHDMGKALREHPDDMRYCLVIDVRKFYPSINHDVLKGELRKMFKDPELLMLLDKIIDSSEKGIPIGGLPSQYFGNLYMSSFDRWIKEEVKIKYYYAYCDDRKIFSNDKRFLHNLLIAIKFFFKYILKIDLKDNYKIIDVHKEGVYFVGYRFYPTHIKLGRVIKTNMMRLVNNYKNKKMSQDEFKRRMASYIGFSKFCNSKNLLKKVQMETGLHFSNFNGKKALISSFYGKNVKLIDSRMQGKRIRLDFIYKDKPYTAYSTSKYLLESLVHIKKFPVDFKVVDYRKVF